MKTVILKVLIIFMLLVYIEYRKKTKKCEYLTAKNIYQNIFIPNYIWDTLVSETLEIKKYSPFRHFLPFPGRFCYAENMIFSEKSTYSA